MIAQTHSGNSHVASAFSPTASDAEPAAGDDGARWATTADVLGDCAPELRQSLQTGHVADGLRASTDALSALAVVEAALRVPGFAPAPAPSEPGHSAKLAVAAPVTDLGGGISAFGGSLINAADGPGYFVTADPGIIGINDGTLNANGVFDIDLVYSGPSTYLAAFNNAIARWEAIITGDIPDVDSPTVGGFVDDLRITATIEPIDGAGNVLGSAGPQFIRTVGGLPITGTMRFDDADVANLVTGGNFEAVILHEMGHVLGLGTLWDNQGLVSGFNYTGTNALNEYRTLTGNPGAAAIPVEQDGGPGTAGGHWDDETFDNELMTGYLGGSRPGNPISRMTIGSLQDLGYQVNYALADPYTLPAGGGGGPGTISINNATVTEGNSGTVTATFTVTRSGGTGAFNVNFATSAGTAAQGSDYVANSGLLSFGANDLTRTVSITVNGDTAIEASETFFVDLSGATAGATISDSQGLGTIVDDDTGDDFAPDNTGTNGTITVGGVRNGSIGTVGDRDWFSVSLQAGVAVSFNQRGVDSGGGTLADPRLRLFNSGGTEIYENDDGGIGIDSLLIYSPTADGTYYIVAGDYGDAATGTYTLSAAATFTEGADTLVIEQQSAAWNALGGSDHLTGTAGVDTLIGGSGLDTLIGGAGSDKLIGGLGADSMTGGADDDLFYFAAADFQAGIVDTITDLATSGDLLRLDGVQFYAVSVSNVGGAPRLSPAIAGGTAFIDTNANGTSPIIVATSATVVDPTTINAGSRANLQLTSHDWAASQSYSRYTDLYNSSGVRDRQFGTYDTGVGGTWDFYWDVANTNASWQELYDYFNVLGQRTSQSGVYEDGTRWTTNHDPQDLQPEDYSITYLTAGPPPLPTAQQGFYDDGTRAVTYWDPTDVQHYETFTTYYDALNRAETQNGTYDDEFGAAKYFYVVYDNQSAQPWSSLTVLYDDAQAVIQQWFTMDNGNIVPV